MSGALPISPGPARAELKSVDRALVSVAHSGRRIVRSLGGHRWSIKFQYDTMTRAEWSPIYAFLVSQVGVADIFTVTMPNPLDAAQGLGTGSPTVDSQTLAGATSIATTWGNLSTLVLQAGDLFKFSGGAKVYMATSDATTDGAGQVTISFRPELHVTVEAAETLAYDNVPFQVSLQSPVTTIQARSGGLFDSLALDMIEVLD